MNFEYSCLECLYQAMQTLEKRFIAFIKQLFSCKHTSQPIRARIFVLVNGILNKGVYHGKLWF